MRDCTNCKWANWRRTASGKLHPSGSGRCGKAIKLPELPPSMYWYWIGNPTPVGGHINRREPLSRDCVYFARPDGVTVEDIAKAREILRIPEAK